MDSKAKSKDENKNKDEKVVIPVNPTLPQSDIPTETSKTSPKSDSVNEDSVSKGDESRKSISTSNNAIIGGQKDMKPILKTDTKDLSEDEKTKSIEDSENQSKQNNSANNTDYGGVVAKDPNQRNGLQSVKEYLEKKQIQLMDSIGTGKYAEVYKAFDNSKKKYKAVKVLDIRNTYDIYKEIFIPREDEVLKKLKARKINQSIIKVYSIGLSPSKAIIIMELAVNGCLADWLSKNGAMNETTACEMFKKIFGSIDYMHSLKCAHRNLNIENILLTENNNPKLSCLGYALTAEDNSLSNTFCGSLPYLAPEIMRRKPYNPFQTDIWSLGICAYIMVNDGLPFPVDDDREMLRKQLNKEWDFKERVAASLSPNIKTMIRKMLEPVGSDRPTANVLMSDPWVQSRTEAKQPNI